MKRSTYKWLARLRSDDHPIVRLWDALIAITATVAALLIPMRLVFGSVLSLTLARHEELTTILFTADLLVRGWLIGWKFDSRGRDQWRRSMLSRRGWFVLDLVTAIPFAGLLGIDALQLLRLLKLLRLAQFMGELRHRLLQYANVMRLIFFAYWLALATHWLACGWLALGGGNLEGEGWSRYIGGVYWAVTTLATVGYGDIGPKTDVQRVYAMGVMIFGVAMFGYIIGNVTRLLANIDPAKARYLENMEGIAAFMKYRDIPSPLQRKIRDYYSYLWEKRMGYDESAALSALPPSLRTEVALFLIRDILLKVPIFKGADEAFLREISLQLRPVVFTPGDYVFREGDVGREMYFISRGTLEVTSGDGSLLFKTITDGDFFGEIALLESRPRTASVRAVDYCDLYSLDKETFDRVVNSYPEIAEHLVAEASRRRESNMVVMRES